MTDQIANDKPQTLLDVMFVYAGSLARIEKEGAPTALIERCALVVNGLASALAAEAQIASLQELRKHTLVAQATTDALTAVDRTLLMIVRELKTR